MVKLKRHWLLINKFIRNVLAIGEGEWLRYGVCL